MSGGRRSSAVQPLKEGETPSSSRMDASKGYQQNEADGQGAPLPDVLAGAPRGARPHIERTEAQERWVLAANWALFIAYAAVTAMVAVAIWYLVVHRLERHVVAWAVAAMFCGIAVPLSLNDIHLHMLHYVRPDLQRYYIRILWLVPIYSIESLFALVYKDQKVYLETLRDCYEAYVIFSLYGLLLQLLGGRLRLKEMLERRDGGSKVAHMLFPFCFMRPWKMGGQFVNRTAVGVWQYTFLKTLVAIITLVLEHTGNGGEGQWSFDAFYIYGVIIINCSQVWAMWCLIMFYHELRTELAPLRPLGKFLVVKAVVFLSFWQSIVISGLTFAKVIQASDDVSDPNYYPTADISAGLEDFLICIEMAMAAIAHRYFFSYRDFYERPEMMVPVYDVVGLGLEGSTSQPSTGPVRMAQHHGAMRAAADMLPVDVLRETGHHIIRGFGYFKSRKAAPDLPIVSTSVSSTSSPLGSEPAPSAGYILAPVGPVPSAGYILAPDEPPSSAGENTTGLLKQQQFLGSFVATRAQPVHSVTKAVREGSVRAEAAAREQDAAEARL